MTVFAKSHHCHSFDHPDKIVVLLLVVRRKRVMTGSGGKIELASESLAQKGAFFSQKILQRPLVLYSQIWARMV